LPVTPDYDKPGCFKSRLALRELLQTDAPFDRGALKRTLGIRLPRYQCAFAFYLQPAPAFECVNEWRDAKGGTRIQLRYFSPQEAGAASQGQLAYEFPRASCLSLREAEIAFARHFQQDPKVVEEPRYGTPLLAHVYTNYTDFGLKFYRVGLAIRNRCVTALTISLSE
jgi:hypothetical protein